MRSAVTDFVTTTAVNHVVSTAIQAGVNTVIYPAQLLLAVGTAATASAATFLIMTTAKLALSGLAYVGSGAYNGVTYFLYKPVPEKLKSEEWDDADEELQSLAPSDRYHLLPS